jgi:uracil phosphoribosyltransferase
MSVFILNKTNSIGSHFIAELRDVQVQKDSLRFRENLERLGKLLAYELSKSLDYSEVAVQTPLGVAPSNLLVEQPVLITILRAGLPFFQGVLNFFDKAQSAFVGAYRSKPDAHNHFQINMEYLASPDLSDKTIILIDPMLATGQSLVSAYEGLVANHGTPKHLHLMVAVASQEGLDYVQKHLPNASIWLGAVDQELNNKAYIVPGLGDAGDLAFGAKE